MTSIAIRRIDRMLSTPPMPLTNISQIVVHYVEENDVARRFVKDYVPLMAYGNGHLRFVTRTTTSSEPEYCQITISKDPGTCSNAHSGFKTQLTLNLKLYRYPLQLLQRILDVATQAK